MLTREHFALMSAQQLCRFAWLGGMERWLRANTEHAVLNSMGSVRKIRPAIDETMGAQRAIVILSDHLQSNVETLALSGERLIIAPVERVNRSLHRMRSPQRLFGPEQPAAMEREPWILLRRVGACRAPLASEPQRGFAKMTRSGAGGIQTSIKGEAVRCEGTSADQRKMAAT
jgi:hypothetical protein